MDAWLLTDGRAGNVNQCLGLAEALGFAPVPKVIEVGLPWSRLPAAWWPRPLAAQRGADRLDPPWPRVVLATGRTAFAPAAEIRRLSAGATVAIAIQNPRMDPTRFDLVVAPAHDRVAGANVIATVGAPHRVTRARLDEAASRFRALIDPLPRPRAAVLIGGAGTRYRFHRRSVAVLAAQLAALCDRQGVGLMVTTSRRTPPAVAAMLRRALAGKAAVLWTGDGDNPYFAFLAAADYVLVTPDSVSMPSEAASTGRPIYVLDMPGGGGRNALFLARLAELGVSRRFAGRLDPPWSYPPLDVTADAAAAIRARLGARIQAG